jgi:uncharacterized protein (TIGR00730 family)
MEPVRLRKATWTGKEVEDAEAAHGISLSLSLQERLHVVGLMREYVAGITQLAGLASTPTVAIFGSARTAPNSPTYQAACETARLLAEAGFGIITGGGPGIMEAANRGAYEAGGKSIGLSIELPHEQFANPYISPELSFNFHYFFMRKLWFAQIAKALIVFPGGFGTMDELWEMMTLSQTGKMPKNTLILIYGRKYWNDVLNLREMVRWGTIRQSEYDQLQYADTVAEAFELIRAGLEKYHMQVDPFLLAY